MSEEQEHSSRSDLQLVQRVQKGDKRAFDLLVIKYQSRVIAIVNRLVRDPSEAQDVAQEAFVKAWRAIGNFRGDSAFYTWIYRIAVNTAKNYLAARNRRPGSDVDINDGEFHDDVALLQDIETPEGAMAATQLQAVIDRALAQLPEELRTALTLREFDGLSYEDIAQIMDCPVGTVRSRIFRAREAIDEQVRPLMEVR